MSMRKEFDWMKLIPVGLVIVMTCMMALFFYPLVNMDVTDIPVSIYNEDQSVALPNGQSLEAGSAVVTAMKESAKKQNSAFKVTELSSRRSLDHAKDDHAFYATIDIPKDFSQRELSLKVNDAEQLVSQSAELSTVKEQALKQAEAQGIKGQAANQLVESAMVKAALAQQNAKPAKKTAAEKAVMPTIHVQVDNSKNVMIANLLKASMAQSGLSDENTIVDTELVNTGADTGAQGTVEAMRMNSIVIPIFLMSSLSGAFICKEMRRKRYTSHTQKWKNIGVQALYALGMSVFIALGIDLLRKITSNQWLPGRGVGFVWLSSLGLTLAVMGLANISLPLGMVAGIGTVGLGFSVGMLPGEVLPDFWKRWVVSWVPQNFAASGLRDIIFNNAGFWNSGTRGLLIIAACGIACVLLAGLMPLRVYKKLDPAALKA